MASLLIVKLLLKCRIVRIERTFIGRDPQYSLIRGSAQDRAGQDNSTLLSPENSIKFFTVYCRAASPVAVLPE